MFSGFVTKYFLTQKNLKEVGTVVGFGEDVLSFHALPWTSKIPTYTQDAGLDHLIKFYTKEVERKKFISQSCQLLGGSFTTPSCCLFLSLCLILCFWRNWSPDSMLRFCS